MITTYSYLDQYKQIGLFEPIDYYAHTEIVDTPFPLTIILSESNEYGISIEITLSAEYTLYPHVGLYPSTTLYPTTAGIILSEI